MPDDLEGSIETDPKEDLLVFPLRPNHVDVAERIRSNQAPFHQKAFQDCTFIFDKRGNATTVVLRFFHVQLESLDQFWISADGLDDWDHQTPRTDSVYIESNKSQIMFRLITDDEGNLGGMSFLIGFLGETNSHKNSDCQCGQLDYFLRCDGSILNFVAPNAYNHKYPHYCPNMRCTWNVSAFLRIITQKEKQTKHIREKKF